MQRGQLRVLGHADEQDLQRTSHDEPPPAARPPGLPTRDDADHRNAVAQSEHFAQLLNELGIGLAQLTNRDAVTDHFDVALGHAAAHETAGHFRARPR